MLLNPTDYIYEEGDIVLHPDSSGEYDLEKVMNQQPTPYPPIVTLVQCHESELKIDLLLSLTQIDSVDVIAALKKHYVEGAPVKNLEISQQAFSRANKRLNKTYKIVQQLNGVL